MAASQWQSFLQNLGTWVGSFTHFSPQGTQLDDRPSILTIEGLNDNQAAKLTLKRQGLDDIVLEFSSLARGLLFFENGAFCQGTIQFSPVSDFGAEFSFIYENRRLRLVPLFDTDNHLRQITLIRESRQGTSLNERPPLQVDQLIGTWKGEATTIYPDLREPTIYPTKLHLEFDDSEKSSDKSSGKLIQTSSFANNPPFTSTATINGSIITFDGKPENPIQVLMLPDGASVTFPTTAKLHQPLFLEAGWLIRNDLRQRMIRSYNDKGEWVSLTLVTEKKIS